MGVSLGYRSLLFDLQVFFMRLGHPCVGGIQGRADRLADTSFLQRCGSGSYVDAAVQGKSANHAKANRRRIHGKLQLDAACA